MNKLIFLIVLIISILGFFSNRIHGSIVKSFPLSTISKVLNVSSNPRFRYRSLINMNNKKAVTLDILVVYDSSLFSIIQAMGAKQYFESRGQLFRDNQSTLTIATWDITPGKASDRYRLKVGVRAVGIIVFASYEGEDQPHRLVIPPDIKEIMILLNERTLLLAENGIDYMDIGPKKQFMVMKNLQEKENKEPDNVIPSGYGNFYTLDEPLHPPAIINDKTKNYKQRIVTHTRNIPVRVEENNKQVHPSSYHIPEGEYIKPKFSNFFQLMEHKLGENMFSSNGALNNEILSKHGIGFFYSSNMTIENCEYQIKMFYTNRYRNFLVMSSLYKQLLAGRSSQLDMEEYYSKFKNKNSIESSDGNASGIRGGSIDGSSGEGSSSRDNSDEEGKNGQNGRDGINGFNKNDSSDNDSNLNGEKNSNNKSQGAKSSNNNMSGGEFTDRSGNSSYNHHNGGGDSMGRDTTRGINGSLSLGGSRSVYGGSSEQPKGVSYKDGVDDPEKKEEKNPEEKNNNGETSDSKSKIPKIPIGTLGKMGSLASGLSSKLSFWSKVAKVVKRGAQAVSRHKTKGKVKY